MKEYILDANAVLIYLEGRTGATKVRQLFEQAVREQTRLGMSVTNWPKCSTCSPRSLGKTGHDRS